MANHFLIPMGFNKNLESFLGFNRDLERLQGSFNNFLSPIPWVKEGALLPDIDVIENEKEIQITADLPGLEENDINIEVNNGIFMLRGEKKEEKEQNRNNYHIAERSSGFFSRTLQLPTAIDEKNVQATLKDGVLKVILPKVAEAIMERKRTEIKKG